MIRVTASRPTVGPWRRSAARSAAAVVVLLPALAGVLPATADDGVEWSTASNQAVQVRVGTYNINLNVAYGRARTAVRRLTERVDVAGLQEFEATSRTRILDELAELGWGYVKPKDGDPVVYDRDDFRLLSSDGVVVAPRGRVEHRRDPSRLKKVGKSIVTVARLWHVPSGRRVVVVDFHAMSKAARGGRPSRTHPRRAERFQREISGVGRIVQREQEYGRVLLLGDWNVDYPDDARVRHPGFPIRRFEGVGVRSMWATQTPNAGTFANGSVIDGIWAEDGPTASAVLTDFPESDHRPVVAVYRWAVTGERAPAPEEAPADPEPEPSPEPEEDPGLVCDVNPLCS